MNSQRRKIIMALEFLDKAGVQKFSSQFLTTVNDKISAYLSTAAITADSTDTVIPSAKAANQAITNAINSQVHLNFETVTGDITAVQNPSDSIIYLQKDNDEDPTWVMYVYKSDLEGNSKWIAIGDTSIDLVNYWGKDENDDLKEKLTINTLSSSIDALVETINAHIDATTSIDDADIVAIMNDAAVSTDNFRSTNPNVVEGVTGADGVISGVSIDMEYSQDQIVWEPVTGDTVDGLATGTYYVRYKATTQYKPSAAVSVAV
jgi:hypothetical protein